MIHGGPVVIASLILSILATVAAVAVFLLSLRDWKEIIDLRGRVKTAETVLGGFETQWSDFRTKINSQIGRFNKYAALDESKDARRDEPDSGSPATGTPGNGSPDDMRRAILSGWKDAQRVSRQKRG